MALALNLSIQQGVSFSPGSTDGVGYLLAATMSGAALAADLTVTDPQTGSSTAAVGVLAQVQWAEGTVDPISVSVLVSARNQSALAQLAPAALATAALTVSFVSYQYDPQAATWYSAFTPVAQELNGVLDGTSQEPGLTVAASATAVGSVSLYQVDFAIVPPFRTVEKLQVASSATQQVIKTWGAAGAVAERSTAG